jgi:Family of unknown function (DUF6049)
MTARVRSVLVTVALAAAALLVGTGAGRPAAGAGPGNAQGARLELVSQTPVVEPGQASFALALRMDPSGAAPSGLTLAATVYGPLLSRSEFSETLDGHDLADPLATLAPANLDQLPRDQAGDLELTVPLDTTGAAPMSSSTLDLTGSEGGVYPVEVTLGNTSGTVIQHLVTYLVYVVPSSQSHQVGLALVLPVQAPIALSRDGQPVISPRWSTALSVLAHALVANSKVSLTLAPSPETIEALADSGRPEDRVTLSLLEGWAQTPGHQVLLSPYVPISLSGLSRAGLSSEITSQVTQGEEVLAAKLRISPSPVNWWVQSGPLDRDALTTLEALGVKGVVVSASELTPVATTLTQAQPFELDGPGQYRPLSVIADAGLTSHFRGGDPSLGAHQTMGDLAQIYFEEPNSPISRAVVMTPPDGWLPEAAFLDPLLSELQANPTVKPMTLSEVFDSVPPETFDGSVRQRQPAETQPAASSLPVAALERARQHADALLSAAGGGAAQLSNLDNLVLAAESSDLSSRDRQRYLSSLEADVDAQLKELSLPGGQTVTLTATAGRIPITIESHASYPVRAVITVSSDRLTFEHGSVRLVTLDQQRDTTEYFDVRTRSPGDFPLQVALVSPKGNLVLLHGRFTIRSTAASAVAIGLTVGAGSFLILWWGRSLVRSRRARLARSAAADR